MIIYGYLMTCYQLQQLDNIRKLMEEIIPLLYIFIINIHFEAHLD
jgi:hypothetical protein